MYIPVLLAIDLVPGAAPGSWAAVVRLEGSDGTTWETLPAVAISLGQSLTFGPFGLSVDLPPIYTAPTTPAALAVHPPTDASHPAKPATPATRK